MLVRLLGILQAHPLCAQKSHQDKRDCKQALFANSRVCCWHGLLSKKAMRTMLLLGLQAGYVPQGYSHAAALSRRGAIMPGEAHRELMLRQCGLQAQSLHLPRGQGACRSCSGGIPSPPELRP